MREFYILYNRNYLIAYNYFSEKLKLYIYIHMYIKRSKKMNRNFKLIRFPTFIKQESNNKIIIGILQFVCDFILEKQLIHHILIQESYY